MPTKIVTFDTKKSHNFSKNFEKPTRNSTNKTQKKHSNIILFYVAFVKKDFSVYAESTRKCSKFEYLGEKSTFSPILSSVIYTLKGFKGLKQISKSHVCVPLTGLFTKLRRRSGIVCAPFFTGHIMQDT